MSPITHFLASWFVGDQILEEEKDKLLVAVAGVLPDLDSLGIVIDMGTKMVGLPETSFYADYHRLLFHGGAGCLAIAGGLTLIAKKKSRVFVLALLTTHLHLLCDFVGSRGLTEEDKWPIWYCAPFSQTVGHFEWEHQWALNAWPNILFTVVLLSWAFWALWRHDRSPLKLVGPKVHKALLDTLRNRFGTPKGSA